MTKSNLYFCNGLEFARPIFGFFNQQSSAKDGLTYLYFPSEEIFNLSEGLYPFYLFDFPSNSHADSDSLHLTDDEKLIVFNSLIFVLAEVFDKPTLFGLSDYGLGKMFVHWNDAEKVRNIPGKISAILESHPALLRNITKIL